jgi:hypothetical protein
VDQIRDVNWKRAKPHEMLGIDKQDMALARDPMIKPNAFRFFKRALDESDVRLTWEQLITVGSMKERDLNALVNGEFHGYIPPVEKLINYMKKQVEKHGPQIVSVQYLKDYWDTVYKVYDSMEPAMLWPSDLVRAHDSMMTRAKYKEDEALKELFKRRKKELAPLSFKCPDMGLEIFPAGSEKDLIREGDKLHHCVARYAKDHATGKTAILFIRRSEDKNTPFYTLEYKNGKINQDHGNRNSMQTDEILKFEKLWLAHVAGLKRSME